MPRVSVIIPVFNAGEFLEECVDSVVKNRSLGELILVDDCSTDHSRELAHKIAAQIPSVRVIELPERKGAAGARKAGLDEATKELVAFVDADDYIEAGAVDDAAKMIDGEFDLCIWTLFRVDSAGNETRANANPARSELTGVNAVRLTFPRWSIHPLGVARKSLYISAYSRLNITTYNSDELLTRLLFLSTGKVAVSGKKYFYRNNPNSMTNSFGDHRLTELASEIWLLNFAVQNSICSPTSILPGSIRKAAGLLIRRKKFAPNLFDEALANFVKDSAVYASQWRFLFLHPLSYFAYLALGVFVRFRKSAKLSSRIILRNK